MANITLWVNSFDAGSDAWTKVGNSPYLNAQDQPAHYVYSTTRNANCGNFGFQGSANLGTINFVRLYIYAYGVATNDFSCLLSGVDTVLGPPAGPWALKYVDVTAILDTWDKINAATLLLDRRNTANNAGVDAAYLYIEYTAGAIERSIANADANLSSGFMRNGLPFARTFSPILSLSSAFMRFFDGVRVMVGSSELSSVFTRLGVLFGRTFAGDVALSSAFARTFCAFRSFVGNITMSGVWARLFSAFRMMDGNTNLSSLMSRYFGGVRSLDIMVGLSASLVRRGSFFRRKVEKRD